MFYVGLGSLAGLFSPPPPPPPPCLLLCSTRQHPPTLPNPPLPKQLPNTPRNTSSTQHPSRSPSRNHSTTLLRHPPRFGSSPGPSAKCAYTPSCRAAPPRHTVHCPAPSVLHCASGSNLSAPRPTCKKKGGQSLVLRLCPNTRGDSCSPAGRMGCLDSRCHRLWRSECYLWSLRRDDRGVHRVRRWAEQ